jgi:ATP-dependent DNA ligase
LALRSKANPAKSRSAISGSEGSTNRSRSHKKPDVRKLLVHHAIPTRPRLEDLLHSVKAQGLEGLVAKRTESKYEPGQRSGAWQKVRVNRGQEFVLAGYTPSAKSFDALIIGYCDGAKLIYAARTRNGFTPASRSALFKKLKQLEIKDCPFANLPEAKSGRVGRWTHGRKDEGLPLAEAAASRPV